MPAAARGRGDAALLGTVEKGGPGTEKCAGGVLGSQGIRRAAGRTRRRPVSPSESEMDRCLLGCREAEREGRAGH